MTDDHTLDAHRCPNSHLTYPGHPRCPECGEPQEGTVDLSERTAEVVTWTTNTATPPGVRSTNSLAIVEFDVDGERVRAIGQLVEDAEVDIGDEVRPVYAEELRDPDAGIREKESQEWDGFRFESV
ncbi:Zn-ribbon domain-containing OB-fold protein [Halomicrococcus gelatinilyticus]|uniref:Zn-ribbon domain-containing OB-fold protein n=1 Tax=Halomicrococcus gelatinilyticus TaxID=1702103 RepID=UPI002E0EC3FA